MIKLEQEIDNIALIFSYKSLTLENHREWLKQNPQEYKDFEKRFVYDCLHSAIDSRKWCEMYDKYDCNDTHFFALGKAALKKAGIEY